MKHHSTWNLYLMNTICICVWQILFVILPVLRNSTPHEICIWWILLIFVFGKYYLLYTQCIFNQPSFEKHHSAWKGWKKRKANQVSSSSSSLWSWWSWQFHSSWSWVSLNRADWQSREREEEREEREEEEASSRSFLFFSS